jgi:hypothetical protein
MRFGRADCTLKRGSRSWLIRIRLEKPNGSATFALGAIERRIRTTELERYCRRSDRSQLRY